MTEADLTPEDIHDRITWLQHVARNGANALHARATFHKAADLTDTETAAIARAKTERRLS